MDHFEISSLRNENRRMTNESVILSNSKSDCHDCVPTSGGSLGALPFATGCSSRMRSPIKIRRAEERIFSEDGIDSSENNQVIDNGGAHPYETHMTQDIEVARTETNPHRDSFEQDTTVPEDSHPRVTKPAMIEECEKGPFVLDDEISEQMPVESIIDNESGGGEDTAMPDQNNAHNVYPNGMKVDAKASGDLLNAKQAAKRDEHEGQQSRKDVAPTEYAPADDHIRVTTDAVARFEP